MEASALQAPAAVARTRTQVATPLLRLRSDEQLVALFRAGHEDAFRAIHDRYRQRLFAYTRQMLPGRQDAEDALQDIFVRAYAGLRANRRELALRAWLYRVAHNRCIDELRRPTPPPPEVIELLRSPVHDPIAEADQRESLRRLIADVRRLPDQQRSALLMRELGGMSYADLAAALGVTIPAVKSLLVRARLALGQALEARDTACSEIREELIIAHDRGRRPNGTARRHLRDCAGCREFRGDLRGVSRRLGAIVPTLGPLGVLANVLGLGTAGGGAGAAGGAVAASGAAGSGSALVSVGAMSAGVTHVATLVAAAVVTAGGAVEIQHTMTAPVHHYRHHPRPVAIAPPPPHAAAPAAAPVAYQSAAPSAVAPAVAAVAAPAPPATASTPVAPRSAGGASPALARSSATDQVVLSTSTAAVTVTTKRKPTGGSTATSPSSTPQTKPEGSLTTRGSARATTGTGAAAPTRARPIQTGPRPAVATATKPASSATPQPSARSSTPTDSSPGPTSSTGPPPGAAASGFPPPAP